MSKCIKKCLLISASTLMLLSAGGSFVNNNSVNARHRRTHRVYRYHTSLRHNAWLSGRYYGKKKLFGRRMPYYRADKRYFRKGWIVGFRIYSNANYRQACRAFNHAYRASGDNDGITVYSDRVTDGSWFPN